MNRIIIIGNGFDLAHKLETSYTNFINHYWSEFGSKIFETEELNNCESKQGDHICVRFEIDRRHCTCKFNKSKFNINLPFKTYEELLLKIKELNEVQQSHCKNARNGRHRTCENGSVSFKLVIQNLFLERISNKALKKWVDIEGEYYEMLRELISEKDSQIRSEKIKTLNKDFNAVKSLLEQYLTNIDKDYLTIKESISNAVGSLIERDDVALRKQEMFITSILAAIGESDDSALFLQEVEDMNLHHMYPQKEANRQLVLLKLENNESNARYRKFKKEYCTPAQTLFLNFNYTKTAEELYNDRNENFEWINIHGELNNNENPIIFGYGDELDDDYKDIEKLRDNDFLENIKSIQYHKTGNYRELLSFVESEPYQVFIMGHSCGNSDRTLLNTIFEHENCLSLKVYYHQKDDGTDDHSNVIRNISRNFNDKALMRDVVVNWKKCTPLVPAEKK